MAVLQWDSATRSINMGVFKKFLFLNSEKAKIMVAV